MADDAKTEHKPDAPPALPPPLPPLAGKAKDLDALRSAVIDAANVGAGLWFSYLFGLLYFLIAIGSVTHRNLLFESPVKLPFLNVDLPLIGFFVLGPAVFLIVHAYVLLHFAMLADKVGVFHAELQSQILDDDIRARLRRQLPSNIFVQFLAGPREVREGLMGWMLRLIAQISLVIGPILLLVFFQFQFLPYHSEAVSWWQRVAVIIDLALLWALWPSIAQGETTSIKWRDFRSRTIAACAVATIIPLLLVFTIATFPGEWLHRNPASLAFIPEYRQDAWRVITPHQFLVAGDVDLIEGKPTSFWSNRLVVPNLDDLPKNFTLRGRHLEGAVLLSARLPKMDFTATNLRGALLDNADLREAKFLCAYVSATMVTDPTAVEDHVKGEKRCAQLRDARLASAQLQGASFREAQMQHAGLISAQLQGAVLDYADLREANLYDAQLQGASLSLTMLQGAALRGANLQAANLFRADLRGAALDGAQLQGAVFDEAEMQAASLTSAQLQGASLQRTHLQGASFAGAGLQAADLDSASLEAASFARAHLQGARFGRVSLEGASFDNASFWRTDPPVRTSQTRVSAPETEPLSVEASDCQPITTCAWDSKYLTFPALKLLMTQQLPEGELRQKALERIRVLDPGVTPDGEAQMAKFWMEQAASPPPDAEYFKTVAELFAKQGCDQEGAPYVMRAMIDVLDPRSEDPRFVRGSAEVHMIANAFLDDANCPGAQGLTDTDKAALRGLRDSQPISGRRGRRGPAR